jgi:hypothetical protein
MTGIAAVLITFTAYVLTHWTICRTTKWRPYARVINLLWFCFLPVYLLSFYLLASRSTALAVDFRTPLGLIDFGNGLLLNFLLLMGYTYFFFLMERGLSLRLMIEIKRSPQGKLTIPELQQIYTYDYILDKRLGQMERMGYARIANGVISGTSKSARLAASNKIVRKILRIEQVMP